MSHEIQSIFEPPALADVGFWEQRLEPQNLCILQQAIGVGRHLRFAKFM